jgi:hypothetical protein
MKLRILDKSNESIISIARGSEPTVRCNSGLCQNVEEILCLKKNVLTIRIPEDLKDRLERTASAQGVSLNQFALYAFTRGLNDVETAQFFKKRIAGKTNESLEKNFDKVIKKVKTRKTLPDWDKL